MRLASQVMSVNDLFDLSGKVAVVTGGGSGIGLQMSHGLAEAGAELVLCARKVERCEEAAAAMPTRALALPCDVTDEDSVAAMVSRVVHEFGRVDILVNNAGTVWGAAPEDIPLRGWQKVVDVNLTGVFLCAQSVGRAMIGKGDGGKIVNIASVAGLHGAPAEVVNALPYHATKGGVIALTRDLAWKWARHGINVNAIAPGWFPSDMANFVIERSPELADRIPLGRFGGPEDLKGAVVFLASRASDYVTGHTLVVDGGQSA
jgi:NAD(P)-dependent dehydrogenase (short-subunit alcohol dehydrogenase family)